MSTSFFRYALTAALLALAPWSLPQPGLAQTSVRNQMNQLKQNESQIQQLRRKTEELRRKERQSQANIADIQQDLEQASRRLVVSNQRYDSAHREVENVTKQLLKSEEDWDKRLKEAQVRLRKMYKFRHYAQVNQLMEAEHLAGLMRRVGYFRYLARQDESMLADLTQRREKLSKLQYQQMLKRQILGREANEQAEAKDKHAYHKAEEARRLRQLTKDRQYYEREQRALEQQSHQIAAMLRARYSTQNRTSYNIKLGTGRFTNPIAGHPITSPFGWRVHPIFGSRRLHTGIDFGAPSGTPIRAADTGVVISTGWQGGYGKTVIVDHGQGIATLYAHTSAYYVRPGQQVAKGQVIAAIGTTGNSTGPHLHLEVRRGGSPVDPMAWF